MANMETRRIFSRKSGNQMLLKVIYVLLQWNYGTSAPPFLFLVPLVMLETFRVVRNQPILILLLLTLLGFHPSHHLARGLSQWYSQLPASLLANRGTRRRL